MKRTWASTKAMVSAVGSYFLSPKRTFSSFLAPREWAPSLIAVGFVLAFLALAADSLGLGARDRMGWKQVLLAAGGTLTALLGSTIVFASRRGIWHCDDSLKINWPTIGLLLIRLLPIGLVVAVTSQFNVEQASATLFEALFIIWAGLFIHKSLLRTLNVVPQGIQDEQRRGQMAVTPSRVTRTTAATIALMGLFVLLGTNAVSDHLDLRLQSLIYDLRVPKLSTRDVSTLEKGYYENILRVDWLTSELGEKALRPVWRGGDVENTAAGRLTEDFLKLELVPSSGILYFGALVIRIAGECETRNMLCTSRRRLFEWSSWGHRMGSV